MPLNTMTSGTHTKHPHLSVVQTFKEPRSKNKTAAATKSAHYTGGNSEVKGFLQRFYGNYSAPSRTLIKKALDKSGRKSRKSNDERTS
jgi:hypothetical protein